MRVSGQVRFWPDRGAVRGFDEAGFQPLSGWWHPFRGALPQAGMKRAFGAGAGLVVFRVGGLYDIAVVARTKAAGAILAGRSTGDSIPAGDRGNERTNAAMRTEGGCTRRTRAQWRSRGTERRVLSPRVPGAPIETFPRGPWEREVRWPWPRSRRQGVSCAGRQCAGGASGAGSPWAALAWAASAATGAA